MKVYYTDDLIGHWPVGTAAVVVAADRGQARRLLLAAAARRGIKQDPDRELSLVELSLAEAHAVVIQDGNY